MGLFYFGSSKIFWNFYLILLRNFACMLYGPILTFQGVALLMLVIVGLEIFPWISGAFSASSHEIKTNCLLLLCLMSADLSRVGGG
jgi:O-antigen ligase